MMRKLSCSSDIPLLYLSQCFFCSRAHLVNVFCAGDVYYYHFVAVRVCVSVRVCVLYVCGYACVCA